MADYIYGVRYWSLVNPEVDPADENSWAEYVALVESEIEATDLFNQWGEAYKDKPEIRNIQRVRAYKPVWRVMEAEP